MPFYRNIAAKIALLPMIVISLTVFVGCIIYSFVYSLTNSKLVPVMNYVGFDQYERLFKQRKWDVAVENIFIYGFVFTIGCLIIGFLLAVFHVLTKIDFATFQLSFFAFLLRRIPTSNGRRLGPHLSKPSSFANRGR